MSPSTTDFDVQLANEVFKNQSPTPVRHTRRREFSPDRGNLIICSQFDVKRNSRKPKLIQGPRWLSCPLVTLRALVEMCIKGPSAESFDRSQATVRLPRTRPRLAVRGNMVCRMFRRLAVEHSVWESCSLDFLQA